MSGFYKYACNESIRMSKTGVDKCAMMPIKSWVDGAKSVVDWGRKQVDHGVKWVKKQAEPVATPVAGALKRKWDNTTGVDYRTTGAGAMADFSKGMRFENGKMILPALSDNFGHAIYAAADAPEGWDYNMDFGHLFKNVKSPQELNQLMEWLYEGGSKQIAEHIDADIESNPSRYAHLAGLDRNKVKENLERSLRRNFTNSLQRYGLPQLKQNNPQVYNAYLQSVGAKYKPQDFFDGRMDPDQQAIYAALLYSDPQRRAELLSHIKSNYTPGNAAEFRDLYNHAMGKANGIGIDFDKLKPATKMQMGLIIGDPEVLRAKAGEQEKAFMGRLQSQVFPELATWYQGVHDERIKADKNYQANMYNLTPADANALFDRFQKGEKLSAQEMWTLAYEFQHDPKIKETLINNIKGDVQGLDNLEKLLQWSNNVNMNMDHIDPALAGEIVFATGGKYFDPKKQYDLTTAEGRDKAMAAYRAGVVADYGDRMKTELTAAATAGAKEHFWKNLWEDPFRFANIAYKQGMIPQWLGPVVKDPKMFWGVVIGGGALATLGIAAAVRAFLSDDDDDEDEDDEKKSQTMAGVQPMITVPLTTNLWRAQG
jgi:hypothetical protein